MKVYAVIDDGNNLVLIFRKEQDALDYVNDTDNDDFWRVEAWEVIGYD